MATEQSSSESPSRKRPRRSKQDPQFVLENTTKSEADTDVSPINKRNSSKTKAKTVSSTETIDTSAHLYEPGDIVWCKLGGFPWWPALIYRCNTEGGIHTKTLNSNNKPKRLFFVYFYGKYLEYSWISTRWLLKYAGLSNFIQHAEAAVQQATTKSEQQELANRFQLKVSMKKRLQWDEAIELADRAITMTKEERIKEFSDLLQEAIDQSRTNVRRQKTSHEKTQDEDDEEEKKRARNSSVSSIISSTIDENETISVREKSSISIRKPIALTQNNTETLPQNDDETKKKRERKTKSNVKTETKKNQSKPINSSTDDNQRVTTRAKGLSLPNKDQVRTEKSKRQSRKSTITNGNNKKYEHQTESSKTSDQHTSANLPIQYIHKNNPPLSNYEQKQIVEGLMSHPKGEDLTFDEAHAFANIKAIEIVYENHNYQITSLSPEWFYESILLRYPSVVFKHRSWFKNIKTDAIPNGNDMIALKQWQIALMLEAQIKAEQQERQQAATDENQ